MNDYSVYMDDGLGGALVFKAKTGSASTLTYQSTGLTIGRSYKFTVSAHN